MINSSNVLVKRTTGRFLMDFYRGLFFSLLPAGSSDFWRVVLFLYFLPTNLHLVSTAVCFNPRGEGAKDSSTKMAKFAFRRRQLTVLQRMPRLEEVLKADFKYIDTFRLMFFCPRVVPFFLDNDVGFVTPAPGWRGAEVVDFGVTEEGDVSPCLSPPTVPKCEIQIGQPQLHNPTNTGSSDEQWPRQSPSPQVRSMARMRSPTGTTTTKVIFAG
ncbi:hypothetical protein J6590_087149 [Homalodisca vitripennis]|nr:hypothetical protein J6590_087149 [Homalodisca vitripennis]